jgi:hypothetical protein
VFQPVQLLRFVNLLVFGFVKPTLEDAEDVMREERTNLLESVILLTDLLEEDGWRGSFVAGKGEFYD